MAWGSIVGFLVLVVAVTGAIMSGMLTVNPVTMAQYVVTVITLVFLAYFAGVFFLGQLDGNEKRKLGALFLVCVASICFWAGFEQAGSSLNLFGRDYTDRMMGTLLRSQRAGYSHLIPSLSYCYRHLSLHCGLTWRKK